MQQLSMFNRSSMMGIMLQKFDPMKRTSAFTQEPNASEVQLVMVPIVQEVVMDYSVMLALLDSELRMEKRVRIVGGLASSRSCLS